MMKEDLVQKAVKSMTLRQMRLQIILEILHADPILANILKCYIC